MLTQRDKMLLAYLRKFRVLSRDQIGKLICQHSKNPHVLVNRIAKRLSRDGYILTVPRARYQTYAYMPNPSVIPKGSSRLDHFMAIADVYIQFRPKIFEIEPQVTDEYRPDMYMRLEQPILVEVQRSLISTSKAQAKVDMFVESYRRKKHDARELWFVGPYTWKIKAPSGFTIKFIQIEKDPMQQEDVAQG